MLYYSIVQGVLFLKRKKFIVNPAIKHIISGVVSGALASGLCMIACSFLLTLKDFSPSVATPLSNICLVVGSFVSGFVCAILHKSRGLVYGALAGVILFAIVTFTALFFNNGDISINTLLRFLFMIVVSAAAGVFGVNKTAKHKMI